MLIGKDIPQKNRLWLAWQGIDIRIPMRICSVTRFTDQESSKKWPFRYIFRRQNGGRLLVAPFLRYSRKAKRKQKSSSLPVAKMLHTIKIANKIYTYKSCC